MSITSHPRRAAGVLNAQQRVLPQVSTTIDSVAIAQWFSLPNNDLRLHGHVVSPIFWLRSGGHPMFVAYLAADLNCV